MSSSSYGRGYNPANSAGQTKADKAREQEEIAAQLADLRMRRQRRAMEQLHSVYDMAERYGDSYESAHQESAKILQRLEEDKAALTIRPRSASSSPTPAMSADTAQRFVEGFAQIEKDFPKQVEADVENHASQQEEQCREEKKVATDENNLRGSWPKQPSKYTLAFLGTSSTPGVSATESQHDDRAADKHRVKTRSF